MYDTITIDTVGLMWQLCEDYICVANNVTALGDIAWGEFLCPFMVRTIQKKEVKAEKLRC